MAMQGFGDAKTAIYFSDEIIANIFISLAANVPLPWFYMRQYKQ